MFEPDANPMMTAKAIVRPLTVPALSGPLATSTAAGIQRQKEASMQIPTVMIMVLNRPSRSAMYPGAHLPTTLPALKMAMTWYAKVELMAPVEREKVVRYVIGMKRPHSSRKTPIVVSKKAVSLKIRKSGSTLPPGFGGSLERTKTFARTTQTRKIKPMTLVAHANPIFGNRACSMMGKTMPPTAPEVAAIPVAFPLVRKNQCPTAATEEVKTRLVPTPPSTPKTIIKCQ